MPFKKKKTRNLEVHLLTREGRKFLNIVFAVDKLWRRIGRAATRQQLSYAQVIKMDGEWEQLTDESKSLIDSIWVHFDRWQTDEGKKIPSQTAKPQDMQRAFKESTRKISLYGKKYSGITINTCYGNILLKQCQSYDRCLVILQLFLGVCPESIAVLTNVKDYCRRINAKIFMLQNEHRLILTEAEKIKRFKRMYA
jgi:hypothetical protein